MLSEVIRRTFSFFTAFLFVMFVGKWVVDGCMPENAHRIMPRWLGVPHSICEPVVQWDTALRREEAFARSGQPYFVDKALLESGGSFVENPPQLKHLSLSRPTRTLQRVPSLEAPTLKLLLEMLLFSFCLGVCSVALGDLFFRRKDRNGPDSRPKGPVKYHIRSASEVLETPFRPDRSLKDRGPKRR